MKPRSRAAIVIFVMHPRIVLRPLKRCAKRYRQCCAAMAQNDYYANPAELAMAYANAVNEEVIDLFNAGVDIVQLDEPYVQARPEAAREYAVAAIDKAVLRFRQRGVEVEVIGLNERSASLLDRLAIHDKPDAKLAMH